MLIPKLPIGPVVDSTIQFLVDHLSHTTKGISNGINWGISTITDMIAAIPPWLSILILAVIAWRLCDRKTALMVIGGFGLIWNLGHWTPMVETFVLVLIASVVSIGIGIPLGVLTALHRSSSRLLMPILDFMQTMPAFVYLIPAIPFFGIGSTAALFAIIVFSIPPVIRCTCCGIQQVPPELIEAANAFGATRRQTLFKVQIPSAFSTMMAGINQTIMLAMSMVIVAAMIGAQGLGAEVWRAIQRLNVGAGFEAGLSVVIVALIFDRVTQKLKTVNAGCEP